MTSAAPARPQPAADRFAVLREIERRVLWLSTAVIHHANRVRPSPSGLTNPTKSRQTPSST
jgi:pyruvate dehydrogenase E1 component